MAVGGLGLGLAREREQGERREAGRRGGPHLRLDHGEGGGSEGAGDRHGSMAALEPCRACCEQGRRCHFAHNPLPSVILITERSLAGFSDLK